ncbi:MAG: AAA family ATPase [Fuerstiella sp.]
MKIRRLDLIRFGPFADQSLSFDGGESGLHLIYGPNEAGKSSALRALRQLLFGIPGEKTCRDNFRHNHADLRIGGEFEDPDGHRVTVVRRKGRQNSLRAADDKTVVDPARLGALLGHMDADRFSTQFGIDYEQLTTGGRAIVTGRGDLGTSLFAAGSGAGNLVGILKSLEQQCDELFKSAGSKPRINAGISRLRLARKQIRDAQLSGTDWQQHRQTLDTAISERDELDSQIVELQAAQGQLQTIEKALPLIPELMDKRNDPAALQDVPLLRERFAETRRDASNGLQAARSAKQTAASRIVKLTAEMQQLKISEDVLRQASAIECLYADLGRYRELCRELPELNTQRHQHEEHARRILRDLGHTPDLEQADKLAITVAERQQIRGLAAVASGISTSVDDARNRLAKAEFRLQEAREELQQLPAGPDGAQLAAAVRRIQKKGDLDQQHQGFVLTLKQATIQADIDLKKKLRWPGTLSELEQAAVPSLESVQDFDDRFKALNRRIEKHQEEQGTLQSSLTETEGSLTKLTLQQNVPTEQNLIESRKLRDHAWALVRRVWEGETIDDEVAELTAQFTDAADLAEAYEQAVAQADETADRLRREADRVAEKARLMAEQLQLKEQLRFNDDSLRTAQNSLSELQSDWEDLWQSTGVVPESPGQMKPWLTHHDQMMATSADLRRQQQAVDSLAESIQTHRTELLTLLEQVQRPVPDDDGTLHRLLDAADQVAQDLENNARNRETRQAEIKRLEHDQKAAASEVEEATEAQENWQQQWTSAVTALSSGATVTASAASAILDSIDELTGELNNVGRLTNRIDLHEEQIAQFEKDLRLVLDETGQSPGDRTWEQNISLLHEQLTESRDARAIRSSKQQQLEMEQSSVESAQAEIDTCSGLLAELCAEAGCQDASGLPEVEEKARRRNDLRQEIAVLETQLQELAGGQQLSSFITKAREEDAATLRPRIDQLNEQIQRLRQDVKRLSEIIGHENAELARMDGSAAAARASEDAEQVLATLRDDAEEYVRLKLASAVLKRSIERYRQNNQGPVLRRASQLFSDLTLGGFAGLQSEYGDNGEVVLVGIRADSGRQVGVAGMSEGTCDQLYLALRIASLEAYFDQHDPVPFIVDDILIQFDDARAAAALSALAELSCRTQVIMFTHHQHLVDVARQQLSGSDALHVQTLQNATMAELPKTVF